MRIRNRAAWLAICFALECGACAAAETIWFGGTQRALPVSLAAPKEDGLRSAWVFNNHGDALWDFNLGTDASIWQQTNANFFQSIGPRFGVATRFQFDSGSFDMWAADVRGGGVYGLRLGEFAGEAFFYHESSHLGDEILESGERPRIDASVNGLRLTGSWEMAGSDSNGTNTAPPDGSGARLRLFGGLSIQPWAEPSELESFGFHAGLEMTRLPPWGRGYVAAEAEVWEWRSWNPDAVLQTGVFIGPKGRGGALEAARFYLEARAGRVMLGQFYNETESYFGVGLGTNW